MTEAELREAAAKLGLVIAKPNETGPRRPKGAGPKRQRIPGIRARGPRRQALVGLSPSVLWRLGEEGLMGRPSKADLEGRV